MLVIQRGHCYRTTGATGAPGEQQFATAAASRVAAHCNALGHETRIINADVPDSSYRGDMFVALHYDSSTSPSAHGASIGFQTPEGADFGHAWGRHYVANGWPDGNFRGDNYTAALAGYYGVRRAVSVGNRKAFIMEAGFHSNPSDAALLASPEGPDRVGRSVAAALVELLGCSCPPGVIIPPPAPLPAWRPYPGLVKQGATGGAVRAWQQLLAERGYEIVVDGVFGPATQHVVIDWQRNHGLVADGIAGPATWHSLLYEPTFL